VRFKTWPVAALALLAMLGVIVGSLLEASRRAQDIFGQLDEFNTRHRVLERELRRLRSDVHLSGIFIRDYLLDHEGGPSADYRTRLTELRQVNHTAGEALEGLAASAGIDDRARIEGLRRQLELYWEAFEPLFDWSPAERITRSARFLRTEVLPRRDAVLSIAREIEEVNNANLNDQRAEVAARQVAFRADIRWLIVQSLVLGSLLAAVAVLRLRHVEGRAAEQQAATAEAEREMRRLSRDLVAMQEEERKHLSRELHDHLGQLLTALRMELGRIERLRMPTNTRVAEAIAESRVLVDDMMHMVRDIAWGLRPSMLDDIGIRPALDWLVAGFSRRSDIAVDMAIDDALDQLDERRRTCVYRIVQEALTNCARHASATRVTVNLASEGDTILAVIEDNGRGFAQGPAQAGLGLRGMRERVRELGGSLALGAGPGAGARLTMRLPIADPVPEAAHARLAG
jgi:signal transduction histidine kinase